MIEGRFRLRLELAASGGTIQQELHNTAERYDEVFVIKYNGIEPTHR